MFSLVLQEIRGSTITSKGQIVIPGGMRSKDGFHIGQKVAVLAFDDRIEVWPWDAMVSKIDWEAEKKKNREILRKIVDKYGLRGRKIKELTPEEKDKIAMRLAGVTPEELKGK